MGAATKHNKGRKSAKLAGRSHARETAEPTYPPAASAGAAEASRSQTRNNRLAPGIRGSRRPRKVRWSAFDQLPECVADAIRESRSVLCPVAALRLVNDSVYSQEEIASFLRRRAAWTDWRVLVADFGEASANLLRPDAPRHRPKLIARPIR
ncbi:MAG: hypothetical protein MRY74_06205 [Neomegalonema sp.]|nr:hypothetical protein [Neomegalonema sp.]